MSKHTPGPWYVRTDSIWGNPVPQGQAVYHTTVAANINNPADRVLIAAAPDMLAALRLVLFAAPMNHPDDDIESFDWIIDARAAIAKATGEST